MMERGHFYAVTQNPLDGIGDGVLVEEAHSGGKGMLSCHRQHSQDWMMMNRG
jgi:hypothetical protein